MFICLQKRSTDLSNDVRDEWCKVYWIKNVTKKTTNKKTFRKTQIISFCVEAGLRLFLAVIRKQSSENQHACVWNYKHFLFGFPALDIQFRALGRLCGAFRSNPHLFAFNVWICSYLKASIWTCVMTPAQAPPPQVFWFWWPLRHRWEQALSDSLGKARSAPVLQPPLWRLCFAGASNGHPCPNIGSHFLAF